jgi:acetoin utilization deacetylase AcuC-like enzyme
MNSLNQMISKQANFRIAGTSSLKPILWLDTEHGAHHGSKTHPESPERIEAIRSMLTHLNPKSFVLRELTDPLPKFQEPVASQSWFLDNGDTYCTAYTSILLQRGRKMIEDATRELALSKTNCGFVFIRPPGHHANASGEVSGFCHQNNVWVAVEHLKRQGFHSIGIFDWDAHHGDGTEHYVRKAGDPSIRFASMHAFGPGIYPGSGGPGSCNDNILNIPLPMGTDSEHFVGYFTLDVLPWLAKGKPDIIIISAGYDGHKEDPMNLLQLRENTYAYMSSQLKLLDCPVLFLLEGGYNPRILAKCVNATLEPWIL